MWRVLLKSVREFKKPSIQSPVYVSMEVVIECVIPFITARLVNRINAGCEIGEIFSYGLLLLLMAGFSLAFGRLSGITCATAGAGFARNLRKDMFHNVQSFSFENIDKFQSSSLVTRLTFDVGFVQMTYMMVVRIAIRSPLMLVFAVIMSFLMGGRLALLFIFVIPVLGLALYLIFRTVHPIFKRAFPMIDELNKSIQENIQGIRVVKSFVREEYEEAKFEKAAENVRREFARAEKILAFNAPVMQFCLYMNLLFIITFGSYTIITSQGLGFDIGQLSALMVYSVQILMSLMMLSMVFVMIAISAEAVNRIAEVLNEKTALRNPENPVCDVRDGTVCFDRVSFRYSEKAERMALENVDLRIESGETIGILGGTGSSKTSLVQLIPRLYDVTEGAVAVGGVDVRNYDIETLRGQVAVVLQNNILFSGTIKENLRWGKPDATDDELREACRLAQADEFISQFPEGYETKIDRGGANVSGGQKQRLCIARALLKKPKVLILDDSTSAVDTHTDARIRKAFREFIPETTKIIIAQRVASVQEADRIVMMDKGSVAAIGRHEELLERSEIYREVYETQIKGGMPDGEGRVGE